MDYASNGRAKNQTGDNEWQPEIKTSRISQSVINVCDKSLLTRKNKVIKERIKNGGK